VTEEYDQGPIIVQRALEIRDDDTPDSFAERLLPIEHECYIEAIRLYCEGKLSVVDPPQWAAEARTWSGDSGRRQHVRRG
jgi:folate-dependent phosphoribosylglycinamide formyltransferase PurN